MSSKLDHSLDEILASSRNNNRRGNKSGPVGGIRKRSTRVAAQKANASVAPNTNAIRNAPKGPAAQTGKVTATATKIIVSNLPYDVTEQMIKEYFVSVVGPIRKAVITYGPDGRSRGVATVEFQKPEHAALAAQKYNGVDVDKRPMKVELVIDPTVPPSFADRLGVPNKVVTKPVSNKQPKTVQPKPVVRPTGPRGGRGGKRGGARGGSGRGKPKTADELDQEMADYFGSAKTAAPAAAPAATNGGDVGMEDTEL